MRFIQQSPLYVYSLNQANLTPPLNHIQATSRWKTFNGKSAVLSSLLRQQFLLCCYSEVRSDLEGLEYHIEHVENKGQNPQRTFDEMNLAASALSTESLTLLKQDAFGGHAVGKQTHVRMADFIHPYLPNCTNFFAYLSDGRIVPSNKLSQNDRSRASYTIDLLNLNSDYLIDLRKQRWDELEKLEKEHMQNNWDISYLLEIELTPMNGKLEQFHSLTRQFFHL